MKFEIGEIVKMVKRRDPCPCGSGNEAIQCCRKYGNRFEKLGKSIEPISTITNYENPKCMFSFSKNCCQKISREHYISEGILDLISREKRINVKGIAGFGSESFTQISKDSLVVKSLCIRHNTSASPLDAEALRLMKALFEIDDSFTEPHFKPKLFLFSGVDIERWMIKTVVGMISARNIRFQGIPFPDSIVDVWSRYLYHPSEMPENLGLCISRRFGTAFHDYRGVDFRPMVSAHDKSLAGVDIFLCGIPFALIMSDAHDPSLPFIRRPRQIVIQRYNRLHRPFVLEFHWSEWRSDAIIIRKEPRNKKGNGEEIGEVIG